MKKSISTKAWPTVAAWAKHRRALAARSSRRLGFEPKRNGNGRVCASQVLNVLGPDSFAEFAAVRAGGRVIWCNFELARQLGFKVPRSNQITPELNEQLLAALSFRAVARTEHVQAQETITMYADKYGGDGVLPGLGAGRAGFLPYGNLYIKGLGFTPLFKHDDPNDFAHSHGALHMDDCMLEALFGEVNENLFAQGSTRVVAIIDEDRSVTAPSGEQIPVAIEVRTGAQLRPGHLLVRHSSRGGSRLEKFIRIASATGQLVTCANAETGGEVPNVRDTMLRIIDDHARTSAESFRWRMIHGALSASNMEMSGAMLDLPTQSTQPRTAPVFCLDANSAFGKEHTERVAHLTPAYRALMRNTPKSKRDLYHIKGIDIAGEMDRAYDRHLQVELLGAAGLKKEAARRIQADRPELARRFTDVILQMVALKNPGKTHVARFAVERVSVLDVFHLLASLPVKYFANPNDDHTQDVLNCLKAVFTGNRFHVAKKQAATNKLAATFAESYRELMNACSDYGREYYDGVAQMRASIIARAAFENEPIDCLYSHKLLASVRKTIADYRSTGEAKLIAEAIDRRISASLRSVDALLFQGQSRRMTGGGIELGMRTIDGISYSVRAWNDSRCTRRLHVSIPVTRDDNHYLTSVPFLGRLSLRQIQALRYRFTTDGWKSAGEAGAVLRRNGRDGLIIDFDDLCGFPLVGRLEGGFYIRGKRDGLENDPVRFGGYAFAIPDRQELMRLVNGSADNSE